jgi:predicted Fe-Mo cluster-binding NifX family protein
MIRLLISKRRAEMATRIAVATTDGKIVNEHFGRARAFYILEGAGGAFRFLEIRQTEPFCGSEDNGADRVYALLEDCSAVLVSRVGPGAQQALAQRGLAIYEVPMPIPEALERISGTPGKESLWM